MPPHNTEMPPYTQEVGLNANLEHVETELVMVTGYTNPEKLAHTPKGESGSGVYAFKLETRSGKITPEGIENVEPNPAFLVKHPKLDLVYGTAECIDGPGDILTFALDHSAPARMKLVGREAAGGRSTCYINIAKDCEKVTVVNYWDAKVCVLPLDEAGAVQPVCHTSIHPGAEYVENNNPDRAEHWEYRQRWPHAHCAVTEPYSDKQGRIYVCDLGKDSVVEYELDGTALRKTGGVQLQAGLGPRHLVFHPTLKVAYIVNELTSSVSVFKYNPKELNGAEEDSQTPGALLEHAQTISTLPSDWQDKQTIKNGVWKAASHCSEIRIHPSGKLLFIGNRGHDSLAVFKIDRTTGQLTLAGIHPSNGMCPRNYNFSLTGRWVIVGNQDSNNITVMEVDEEVGSLKITSSLPCPSPNYVYVVPPTRLVSNQMA
mmetsp:Transcript_49354/g.100765  ORF Transcript_49354/g.100765 Transcript_49354/m.100765 type:complete len:430 (-) Transcript_49354:440-1729(-)